ncbi:transposase [Streptomyces sp. NPDC058664]|uniref:transposase n=1 Tax=Streptomyces sp. NPDC058664 TaxID=3346585 RepID=UPI00364F485B
MTAALNQWSERPRGPGGHSSRAINGNRLPAIPGPPGPLHILRDRLRTPPPVVGRRHLGTPAPAGPGHSRRRRRDRPGRLGRLHHRPRASARGRRPHRPTAGPGIKGGRRDGTPGRDAVAESGRPPGGGGAGGEGLGRSRGGFTSKLHLSADDRCRPLSLIVTPGQRADCAQFEPVLEKIRVPRPGLGRPRKKPDSLAADKAYSNGPIREYLRRRGIRHTL